MKDWVTLTLSVLAFFLSVVGTYFTFVRQEDNVSFVNQGMPFLSWNADNYLEVQVEGPMTVVFINSGTRSAVVISVGVFIDQTDETQKKPCNAGEGWGNINTLQTDWTPQVIKEKEIVAKPLRILDAASYKGTEIKKSNAGYWSVPVLKQNLEKEFFSADVCLDILLATPSSSSFRKFVQVADFTIQRDGLFLGGGRAADAEEDWRRPKSLVKERSTIFGW